MQDSKEISPGGIGIGSMATGRRRLVLLVMVWNDGMVFTKADNSREGMENKAGPYSQHILRETRKDIFGKYP